MRFLNPQICEKHKFNELQEDTPALKKTKTDYIVNFNGLFEWISKIKLKIDFGSVAIKDISELRK